MGKSKKHLLLLLLVLSVLNLFGQSITYNKGQDTNDHEIIEVMKVFEAYLASNPSAQVPNEFWNIEVQKADRRFDFLEDEFQPSLYMGLPVHILSLKFKGEYCQIKAQFSYCDGDRKPYVLAIVNYYAKKESGKYRLYNALTLNKRTWLCTSVGIIDFYYPSYHKFNYSKAEKLLEYVENTCSKFGVNISSFEYYLADDYDEIQELKGIDYYIGMGGRNSVKGKASSGKVYCAGLGEFYPHEVYHVLIDKHFPKQHMWTSEGIATLLGGSRGQSLEWHIKRANKFLEKHDEINLNNMLELRNIDNLTAYQYVLGGLIAKRVFEKGNYELLVEFMSSGTSDEDYYRAIEHFLGVKRSELNHYIRKELRIESGV